MKITAESTSKIVELVRDGRNRFITPVRIWEAVTEDGVKCHLYVTRVAVAEGQEAYQYERFKRELQEQRELREDNKKLARRNEAFGGLYGSAELLAAEFEASPEVAAMSEPAIMRQFMKRLKQTRELLS